MAQIANGILGAFTGKIGPVSGYVRNGKGIMRTAASIVTDKTTERRMAQREKIKVCNNFMNAFTGTKIFSKTFPAYGHGGSGYNRAVGSLMRQAITGDYPNISIAYPLVLVSKGPVPSALFPAATPSEDGSVIFSWTDNSGTGIAKENDKVVLVACCPELNQVVYSLFGGKRKDCLAVLDTSVLKGFAAETWIGFLSEDEKDAANSVYTGRIEL